MLINIKTQLGKNMVKKTTSKTIFGNVEDHAIK